MEFTAEPRRSQNCAATQLHCRCTWNQLSSSRRSAILQTEGSPVGNMADWMHWTFTQMSAPCGIEKRPPMKIKSSVKHLDFIRAWPPQTECISWPRLDLYIHSVYPDHGLTSTDTVYILTTAWPPQTQCISWPQFDLYIHSVYPDHGLTSTYIVYILTTAWPPQTQCISWLQLPLNSIRI